MNQVPTVHTSRVQVWAVRSPNCFSVCAYRCRCRSSFCLPQRKAVQQLDVLCLLQELPLFSSSNQHSSVQEVYAVQSKLPLQGCFLSSYAQELLQSIIIFWRSGHNILRQETWKTFQDCSLSLHYQPELKTLFMLSWK